MADDRPVFGSSFASTANRSTRRAETTPTSLFRSAVGGGASPVPSASRLHHAASTGAVPLRAPPLLSTLYRGTAAGTGPVPAAAASAAPQHGGIPSHLVSPAAASAASAVQPARSASMQAHAQENRMSRELLEENTRLKTYLSDTEATVRAFREEMRRQNQRIDSLQEAKAAAAAAATPGAAAASDAAVVAANAVAADQRRGYEARHAEYEAQITRLNDQIEVLKAQADEGTTMLLKKNLREPDAVVRYVPLSPPFLHLHIRPLPHRLREANASTSEDCRELRAENARLSAAASDADARRVREKETADLRIAALGADLAGLQTQVAQLQAATCEGASVRRRRAAQAEGLERRNDELLARVAGLEEACVAGHTEGEQQRAALQGDLDRLRAEAAAAAEVAVRRADSQQQELQLLLNTKAAQAEALRNEQAERAVAERAAAAALQGGAEEERRLREEIELLGSMNDELATRLEASQAEATVKSRELSRLSEVMAQLGRENTREISSLHDQVTMQEAVAAELASRLESSADNMYTDRHLAQKRAAQDARVAEVEEALRAGEEERRQLARDNSSLVLRMETLNRQLGAATEESERLQSGTVVQLTQRVGYLEGSLEKAHAENATLRDAAARTVSVAQRGSSGSGGGGGEVDATSSAAAAAASQHRLRIETLTQDNHALQRRLNEFIATDDVRQEEVQLLESMNTEVTERMEAAEREKARLSQEVSALLQKVGQLGRDNEEVISNVRSMQNDTDTSTALRQEVAVLSSVNKELVARLEGERSTQGEAAVDAARLAAELSAATCGQETLRADAAETREKLAAARSDVARLRAEADAAAAQSGDAVREAEAEAELCRAQLERAKRECRELQAGQPSCGHAEEIELLSSLNEDLEARVRELTEENRRLECRGEDEGAQARMAQASNEQLRAAVERLEAEQRELRREEKSTRRSRAAAAAAEEEEENDAKQLKELNTGLERAVERLSAQVLQLEANNEELLAALERQREERAAGGVGGGGGVECGHEEEIELLNSLTAELESEVMRLRGEESRANEAAERVGRAEREREELTTTVEAQKRTIERRDVALAEARNADCGHDEELEDLRASRRDAERELRRLQEAAAAAEEGGGEELREARRSNERLEAQVLEARREAEATAAQLARDNDGLRVALEELKRAGEDCGHAEEIDALGSLNAELERQLASVERDAAEREAHLQGRVTEAQRAAADAAAQQPTDCGHADEIEVLNSLNAELEKQVTSLQDSAATPPADCGHAEEIEAMGSLTAELEKQLASSEQDAAARESKLQHDIESLRAQLAESSAQQPADCGHAEEIEAMGSLTAELEKQLASSEQDAAARESELKQDIESLRTKLAESSEQQPADCGHAEEIEVLNSLNTELEKEVAALKESSAQQPADCGHSEEIEALNSLNAELEKQVASLQESSVQQPADCGHAEEIEVLNSLNAELEKEVAALKESSAQQPADCGHAEEIEAMGSLTAELEKQLASSEQDAAARESELKQDIESLRTKLAESSEQQPADCGHAEEIEVLNSLNTELEKEVAALKESSAQQPADCGHSEEIEVLSSLNAELEKQVASLQESAASAAAPADCGHAEEIEVLNSLNAELEKQLANASSSSDEASADLRRQLSELQSEVADLRRARAASVTSGGSIGTCVQKDDITLIDDDDILRLRSRSSEPLTPATPAASRVSAAAASLAAKEAEVRKASEFCVSLLGDLQVLHEEVHGTPVPDAEALQELIEGLVPEAARGDAGEADARYRAMALSEAEAEEALRKSQGSLEQLAVFGQRLVAQIEALSEAEETESLVSGAD